MITLKMMQKSVWATGIVKFDREALNPLLLWDLIKGVRMYKSIEQYCTEQKIKDPLVIDKNLVYKNNGTWFVVNYKHDNGYEFGCVTEVKDMEKFCNAVMKYLEGSEWWAKVKRLKNIIERLRGLLN